MRPLRVLGIYAAAVVLGGALVAPWLFWISQSLSHSFPSLAQQPFQRLVINSLLVVALVGLWPLLRGLGATSLRDAGLPSPIGHGKELLGGLALGLASLAVVALVALLLGGREFATGLTAGRVAGKLTGAVFTAAVVAVVEELLFRGGIFGGLRRVFHWQFALVLSSMAYAVLHFLEDADYRGAVSWYSGLELLPRMFGGDAGGLQLAARFFNLTLAGTLLGLAFQRTGNLWFSIGLHAGWIFWLASYRVFTKDVAGTSVWFWGGGRMVDGWLAMFGLAAALAIFTRLRPARRRDRFA
jgi:uncharacterized protein